MHHDEIAFCQAIIDNPEDDCIALQYADWLAERGMHWMAKALRHAVEFGKRPEPTAATGLYYWPAKTSVFHWGEEGIGYGAGVLGYHKAIRRLAFVLEAIEQYEFEESRRQREAMQDLPF